MTYDDSHYNLPPELFEMFLDRDYRAYSAGRWDLDADDLETAQRFNLSAIINALELSADSSVLDIGCGWGAFARVCPCDYVGLTSSRAQADYVNGGSDGNYVVGRVVYPITWQQFATTQKFDAVVANEVIEHITSERDVTPYRRFFEFTARCSTPEAKLYVQTTLQRRVPRTRAERSALWFILRRVFPGSITADMPCIQEAIRGLYKPNRVSLDHDDYIATLEAWLGNLHDNRYEFIAEFGRDQFLFFDRYFSSCLELFDAGVIELLRATFSKVEAE